MICRNKEKALKVQQFLADEYNGASDIFFADFQRLAEVKRAALAIRQKYPQIHVLINNAGVFNKRRKLTPDGNEMIFGIIHLGSFLLTKLLMESLKRGAPSRVIDINSEAHRFGGLNLKDLNWRKRPYVGMFAYGAAKIAQIQTALLLADQMKDSGVTINLMHPGAVRTNIGMNNNFLYRWYSHFILRWFLKDPAQSGEAIYYLAADPSLQEVTGRYFNQTIEEKPAWYTTKPQKRQAVWDRSMALIQSFLEESQ
jgi:NAD(P)-dependent dehydrogenase (short-subunit alcohol dehydrogenase family)